MQNSNIYDQVAGYLVSKTDANVFNHKIYPKNSKSTVVTYRTNQQI